MNNFFENQIKSVLSVYVSIVFKLFSCLVMEKIKDDFSIMMECTEEIGNRHSVCVLWLHPLEFGGGIFKEIELSRLSSAKPVKL